MKNIFKIVTVFLFIGVFTACVQDDDYSIPGDLGVVENLKLNELLTNSDYQEVSIQYVKDLYVNGEVHTVTSDIYVKGYVSSSDESGNFYKEFFLQDDPTNPTVGIKILVDLSDTFAKFNLGREVYVNLKGLYIGESKNGDGVTSIGGAVDVDEVDGISENRAQVQLLRSDVTNQLTALPVTFSQINASHVGIYVIVADAQFASNIAGTDPFVSPYDDFDSQRTMESCEGFGYTNFILESSTFASFKDFALPAGGGTIAAVVSKDYYGDNFVLALNTINDVNMNDARCTPLDINDFTTIFSEDFDTAVNNTDLDIADWTNFAEEGSRVWREKTYSGNGYAELSGFGSGDVSNIAWLVSPGIDMDAQNNEFLNFKTAQHHLDDDVNNTLEVFVSTDYNGADVLGATWVPVLANTASEGSSWYDFIDSGLIDVSGYTGTMYVAFKYTGSGTDTSLDGSYQVEDFTMLAN
jgi:hypothetical protein